MPRCKYHITEQRVICYMAVAHLHSMSKEVLTSISALVRFLSKIIQSITHHNQNDDKSVGTTPR